MATTSYGKLLGSEKAAIILLALDEKMVHNVFKSMTEEEIKEISLIMSSLGHVRQEIVDRLVLDLSSEIKTSVNLIGTLENTEKLLERVLGKDKVHKIMEELRGPAGKNTWDKLANVGEEILVNYLRNEHPQTAALIISKLSSTFSAKILSLLPSDFSIEVITRIINMGPIKKEVLDNVEKALKVEFISTLSKSHKYDSNAVVANIFNNFDRTNEEKYMKMLKEKIPEAAETIKDLMFTFEDIIKVDGNGIQTAMRFIDKAKLAMALKGATEPIKDLFFSNMSQRAAKILQEDIKNMPPIKVKDVEEAKSIIVNIIKDLTDRGEITIKGDDPADSYL